MRVPFWLGLLLAAIRMHRSWSLQFAFVAALSFGFQRSTAWSDCHVSALTPPVFHWLSLFFWLLVTNFPALPAIRAHLAVEVLTKHLIFWASVGLSLSAFEWCLASEPKWSSWSRLRFRLVTTEMSGSLAFSVLPAGKPWFPSVCS